MAEPLARPAGQSLVAVDWGSVREQLQKPGVSRLAWLVAAAAAVALVVAVALWSATPGYEVLYRGLAESDAGEVMDALQKADIPFQVDDRSGALTVPGDLLHEARIKLAAQGLPNGAVDGFELLERGNGFGTSQTMESARLQRALEGELARTVMSIGAVEQARVHLALPEDSVFVSQRQPPAASVLVKLYPGRVLGEGQVAAIVHLVSSSVPKLDPERVTVADQRGNLLTRAGRDAAMALSLDQLEYTRRMEERAVRRIEDILLPLLGEGRVRARVAMDLDFTRVEQTAERFDPKDGMTRSEHRLDESNARPRPGGIPGALSNQPPGVAEAPEQAGDAETDAQAQAAGGAERLGRSERTRNYELDKVIEHTRGAPVRVRRLSAAVVIDTPTTVDEAGNTVPAPMPAEELERLTALVRQAVGFDAERGDTVDVMSAAFAESALEQPLPWWQERWFLELAKWGIVALVALLALLLVVRPALNRLLPEPAPPEPAEAEGEGAGEEATPGLEEGIEGILEEDRVDIDGTTPRLGPPARALEKRILESRHLVAEDPKRAVQVIKAWIEVEE